MKREAPAAQRNRLPILGVLRQHLPRSGLVLEIASGSGEHAAWYAEAMPELTWQPTDRDPEALRSIEAWRAEAGLANLRAPFRLDAAEPWPRLEADAIVAINMIHIAPWAATLGLMEGAADTLPPGGVLFLYGPFTRDGLHTAASNQAFDADLRGRNAAWGVRDLSDVTEAAAQAGFSLAAPLPMPANNLSLFFHRR